MVEIDTAQSRLAFFIVLSSVLIVSVPCSLYVFYKFVRYPVLRQRVNNQAILFFLILCFVQAVGELPLSLIFLRTNSSAIQSDEFCLFWILYNYVFSTGGLWTAAIVCIQRYGLVFHRAFVERHLLLCHYIPLAFCFLYPFTLYLVMVIKYPCTNAFDYSYWTCGGPCYIYQMIPGTLDWVVNGCFDLILSILATWTIIIRVLIQRSYANVQRTAWQRSRRVIIQIFPLSALYTIVWMPCVICFVIPLFTPVPFLTAFYSAYLSYYQYFTCLLCPFACLLGSTDLRQHRRVQPTVRTMEANH